MDHDRPATATPPETETAAKPVVCTLTRLQRRTFGVLLEKAFTTPDQYPLTLKAVTTGCNQKSNRAPLTNYAEDNVMDALDELREMGLVLEMHTESGRTPRYRHTARQHYSFSEPQLAIVTELLLRGRQTLGDLRSRAGRMVPIESLEDLRAELDGLLADRFVQASGPLDRRGVEVDHAFYESHESTSRIGSAPASSTAETPARTSSAPAPAPAPATSAPATTGGGDGRVAALESTFAELRAENRALHDAIEELRDQLRDLDERFESFRQSVGG